MNVVFYVLDSLRADHVSAYGYARTTTPHIDKLAEDGILFEQCISPSTWTRPVAASILSGLYPPTHGNYEADSHFTLPYRTLPEQLRAFGYDTLAVTSGNMNRDFGFDVGFDEYVDDIDQGVPDQADNRAVAGTRGEEIRRTVTNWLDARESDNPFFALLWSTGTHIPYAPPEGYYEYVDSGYEGPIDGSVGSFHEIQSDGDRDQLIGLYDGEVRFNDRCIGELAEELRDRALFDETLFVVTADHGELFGERGYYGHRRNLFPLDGLVHVPFIVRTPNGTQGERVSEQISLVDVYPTLVELVSAEEATEPEPPLQGTSFAPAMYGDEPTRREYTYTASESDGMLYSSVRSSSWKFIQSKRIETESGDADETSGPFAENMLVQMVTRFVDLPREEKLDVVFHPLHWYRVYSNQMYGRRIETDFLFSMQDEPDEEVDLADEHETVYESLENELRRWLAACERRRERLSLERESTVLDEDAKTRLRKLGYLQDDT